MNSSNISKLALVAIIGITSCDTLEPEEIAQELTQQALNYLISSDAVFTFDGLDDAGYQDEDAGATAAASTVMGALRKSAIDTLWPGNYDRIRTRRRITDVQLSITIDSSNTEAAYVSISRSLTAEFTIAGFNDSAGVLLLVDSTIKSFTMSTFRRARFVNTGTATDSSDGWKLDGLTALTGAAGSRVAFEGITVSDSSGAILSLTAETLPTHFFNRDNLPSLKAQQSFDLFVTVSNTGPEFPVGTGEMVGLHRGGRHGTTRYRVRRNLHDRGIAPDEVAGDNVYSRRMIAGAHITNIRPFRMFVDVVDIGGILVAVDEFSMAFAGIPYRISE